MDRIYITDGDCVAGGPCPHSFEIVSGNPSNALRVDSDGIIYVNNATAIDYEQFKVIAIGVRISDGSLATYVLLPRRPTMALAGPSCFSHTPRQFFRTRLCPPCSPWSTTPPPPPTPLAPPPRR